MFKQTLFISLNILIALVASIPNGGERDGAQNLYNSYNSYNQYNQYNVPSKPEFQLPYQATLKPRIRNIELVKKEQREELQKNLDNFVLNLKATNWRRYGIGAADWVIPHRARKDALGQYEAYYVNGMNPKEPSHATIELVDTNDERKSTIHVYRKKLSDNPYNPIIEYNQCNAPSQPEAIPNYYPETLKPPIRNLHLVKANQQEELQKNLNVFIRKLKTTDCRKYVGATDWVIPGGRARRDKFGQYDAYHVGGTNPNKPSHATFRLIDTNGNHKISMYVYEKNPGGGYNSDERYNSGGRYNSGRRYYN